MSEQRRHVRIRFKRPPRVCVGQYGMYGGGFLENLSIGGFMVRMDQSLTIGESVGCEFSVFDSPLIDLTGKVVSKVGHLYGIRFESGPVSDVLLADAIQESLRKGYASRLSVNGSAGQMVMRVVGGLNGSLRNDFMHALKQMGVRSLDLSEVTSVDSHGLELCRIAANEHHVSVTFPKISRNGKLAKKFETLGNIWMDWVSGKAFSSFS